MRVNCVDPMVFSPALASNYSWSRPADLDKLIEPLSRIRLHHRSIVERLTVPFRSWKIFVVPSSFSYSDSTTFRTSSLFTIENVSVILWFYKELIWIFFKKTIRSKERKLQQRCSKNIESFIISVPSVRHLYTVEQRSALIFIGAEKKNDYSIH